MESCDAHSLGSERQLPAEDLLFPRLTSDNGGL